MSGNELKKTNALLTVLAVVAVGFLLLALRGVFLPLFVAFFLSYLGMPVMRVGRRLRLPTFLNVLLVIGLFGVVLTSIGFVFYTSGAQFADRLPIYRERLTSIRNEVLKLPQIAEYVTKVEEGRPPKVGSAEESDGDKTDVGGEGEGDSPEATKAPSDPAEPEADSALTRESTRPAIDDDPYAIIDQLPDGDTSDEDLALKAEITPKATVTRAPTIAMDPQIDWQKILRSGGVVDFAGSLLGGASNLFLILIFLIFFLLDRGNEVMDRRIVQAFSKPGTESAAPVLEEIHHEIESYIVTKTAISVLTGGLVALFLHLVSLPFALLFGMMAFTMNFVPNVGSIIASIPPLLVAAVHFPDLQGFFVVAGLLLAIQGVVGNFLDPMVTAHRLNLNPVTVMLWLVVWGWLWGIWGMVLAVPLAAVTRIISERTKSFRAIGTLMSEQ